MFSSPCRENLCSARLTHKKCFAMVTIPSYFTSAHRTRVLSRTPRHGPCVSRYSFLSSCIAISRKFLDTALLNYRGRLIICRTETSCKTSSGYLAHRFEVRGNCARYLLSDNDTSRATYSRPRSGSDDVNQLLWTFLAHGRHASLLSLPFLVPFYVAAVTSATGSRCPFSMFSLTSLVCLLPPNIRHGLARPQRACG